jgi:hypothetical protein
MGNQEWLFKDIVNIGNITQNEDKQKKTKKKTNKHNTEIKKMGNTEPI